MTDQGDVIQQLLWMSYFLSGMCLLFRAWRSAVLAFVSFSIGFLLMGCEVLPLFWNPLTHALLAPVVYWADGLSGTDYARLFDSPRDAAGLIFVLFGAILVTAAATGALTHAHAKPQPTDQPKCPFYREGGLQHTKNSTKPQLTCQPKCPFYRGGDL